MRLFSLLEALPKYEIFGEVKRNIAQITDDSRKVGAGYLFVAVKGLKINAHEFIPEALEKGALAVVGEESPRKKWLKSVTYIKVKDSREALSLLAARWYDNPSSKLKLIGVTGTKGKTTTAIIIYHILRTAGYKVGIISSVGVKIGNKEYDTGLHVTSPEPLVLQKFLYEAVKEKCRYAVVEVTSHGLDQERFAGIKFTLGILTNISREHLDYHKNINTYRAAKAKLFINSSLSVLNKDDASYKYFKGLIKNNLDLVTYGIHDAPNYLGLDIKSTDKATSFSLRAGNDKFLFETKMLGQFNVLNYLAAIATCRKLGVSWEDVVEGVRTTPQIEGRMEKIVNNKGFKIYIDFAHTPDSLDVALFYLNNIKKGRLISVFGSAGERDSQKRPKMGKVAAGYSDIVILTSEDPRSEDPKDIISQIKTGIPKGFGKVIEILDRKKAIEEAIKLAKPGDIIALFGKGHEKSMNLDGIHEMPWSEHRVVRLALKNKLQSLKKPSASKKHEY